MNEQASAKEIISTTIDDETGNVKIKALPYVNNPKFMYATTRKDYIEHGVSVGPKSLKKLNKKRSTKTAKMSNLAKSQISPKTLTRPESIDNSQIS